MCVPNSNMLKSKPVLGLFLLALAVTYGLLIPLSNKQRVEGFQTATTAISTSSQLIDVNKVLTCTSSDFSIDILQKKCCKTDSATGQTLCADPVCPPNTRYDGAQNACYNSSTNQYVVGFGTVTGQNPACNQAVDPNCIPVLISCPTGTTIDPTMGVFCVPPTVAATSTTTTATTSTAATTTPTTTTATTTTSPTPTSAPSTTATAAATTSTTTSTNNTWMWVGIGVGGAVLLGALLYFFMRKSGTANSTVNV